MSQKIKRRAGPGGGTVRKAAAAQGKAAKARAVRRRTGSALDAVMAWVPLSDEMLHRVFLVIILGAALALAALVAAQAGVPALASQQMATVSADAGFEVHKVKVRGTQHLNELKVYERVLVQRDRAMTTVDLAALRADLLHLSWVKDARVSRQLPDTLVVDIVERKPHAVMRSGDHLVLIDETGATLDPVTPADAKGMLVLSGEGVTGRVAALAGLLDMAPALKPQVAEAEWVGNRRWNVLFKTGQVLALPEGEQASADALVAVARLDGTNRLLGGRVAAFDMRAPDRIYLRVPGRSSGGDAAPGVGASGAHAAGASGAAVAPVATGSGTLAPAVAAAAIVGAADGAGRRNAPAHTAASSTDKAPATHKAQTPHLAEAAHHAKPAPVAHQAQLASHTRLARPAPARLAHAAPKAAVHQARASHPAKAEHQAKAAAKPKGSPIDAALRTAMHTGARPSPHPAHRAVVHTASRQAD